MWVIHSCIKEAYFVLDSFNLYWNYFTPLHDRICNSSFLITFVHVIYFKITYHIQILKMILCNTDKAIWYFRVLSSENCLVLLLQELWVGSVLLLNINKNTSHLLQVYIHPTPWKVQAFCERSHLLFRSQLCYEEGNMNNLHLTIFATYVA